MRAEQESREIAEDAYNELETRQTERWLASTELDRLPVLRGKIHEIIKDTAKRPKKVKCTGLSYNTCKILLDRYPTLESHDLSRPPEIELAGFIFPEEYQSRFDLISEEYVLDRKYASNVQYIPEPEEQSDDDWINGEMDQEFIGERWNGFRGEGEGWISLSNGHDGHAPLKPPRWRSPPFKHDEFRRKKFRRCKIDIQKLDKRCPRPGDKDCQKCKKYALDSSLNERAKGINGLPDEASYPKVCLQTFALLPGPVVQVMSSNEIADLVKLADSGKCVTLTIGGRTFRYRPDHKTIGKMLQARHVQISDRYWVPRVHYDGKTGCDNDEEILEFFQENPQPFDGSTPQKRRWQYRLTHPIGISADDRVLKLFEEHPEEARDAMKALWNLYREFTVSPTWENLIDRMGENKFNLLVEYNILKRIDLGYISRSSLYFYSDMRINSQNS